MVGDALITSRAETKGGSSSNMLVSTQESSSINYVSGKIPHFSNINRILHNFCVMSGQLVNFHKSLLQFSINIQGGLKKRLGEALNILYSNDISKYRGCLIIQGRVKRNTFFEVMLKFRKSWLHGKRFLSRANKITIIKVNLASTPLHVILQKEIMKI